MNAIRTELQWMRVLKKCFWIVISGLAAMATLIEFTGCHLPSMKEEFAIMKSFQRIHEAEERYYCRHGYYASAEELRLFASRAMTGWSTSSPALSTGAFHAVMRGSTEGYSLLARGPVDQLGDYRSFYSDQTQIIHTAVGHEMASVQGAATGERSIGLPCSVH